PSRPHDDSYLTKNGYRSRTVSHSIGAEQSLPQGETNQLAAVVQPQLFHDARPIGVHGLRGNRQLAADLRGAEALRGVAENFQLTLAQPGQRILLAYRLPTEPLQQELGRLRIEEDVAARDGADRLDQLL